MDCTVSPRGRQALPRPTQSTVIDVAVIGAGPSGALLAYVLAQRGMRVVLIEKTQLPRVKPCGDGLNHLAAEALVEASAHDATSLAYATNVEAEIMPELTGARLLQQLFDAYPRLLHTLIRCRPRYWHALARILRGERDFGDVERVLHRHPHVVHGALWYGQKARLCNSFAARLS